jgi:hypothetical protein
MAWFLVKHRDNINCTIFVSLFFRSIVYLMPNYEGYLDILRYNSRTPGLRFEAETFRGRSRCGSHSAMMSNVQDNNSAMMSNIQDNHSTMTSNVQDNHSATM